MPHRHGMLFGLAFGLLATIWLSHDVKASTIYGANTNLWGAPIYAIPWIQHTYACTSSAGVIKCFTFPSSATKTGGGLLVTGTTESLGIIRAQCYAKCSMTYGVNGVCHQHTNRVLYPSNYHPTLPTSVTGYSTSRWLFGARGTNWSQCLSQCGDW
jgi:hypothetical protein